MLTVLVEVQVSPCMCANGTREKNLKSNFLRQVEMEFLTKTIRWKDKVPPSLCKFQKFTKNSRNISRDFVTFRNIMQIHSLLNEIPYYVSLILAKSLGNLQTEDFCLQKALSGW